MVPVNVPWSRAGKMLRATVVWHNRPQNNAEQELRIWELLVRQIEFILSADLHIDQLPERVQSWEGSC